MSLQAQFINFNAKIRLDYNVNSELKDKRDILVDILRNSGKLPGFTVLNQGSYSMHTGVESIDKEYDIDVGLRFDVNKDDYEPMGLKNSICDILENHTVYGSTIKKPCVTVTYKKDGEPAYHVDLVVYTYEDKSDHNSQMYLARGKASTPDEICWEESDPKGLVDYINDAVNAGDDRDQYRRVIRYIKRWKNLKFDSNGHAEPASIGITLIAADYFELCFSDDGYDDLSALISLVKKIQSLFTYVGVSDNGRLLYRIKYPMPCELMFKDDTDTFEKMTDSQMTDFKDKTDKFVRDLEAVQNEADEVEQCKKLHKIFGDDFEVPEAKNVSKTQMNYIPSSSASGVL
ncbi:nucleotidyltransferase [Sedimentibacter sp. zth1]|uniref:nucleotidyltransferase domain-containing protein n=1 Tax=Sedimentibacter sp. zth1 TaxID=2816908 RepID=UPI001A90D2A7|nr:nucleotidyltransferase [Sedimentibacter sp. zth1]QSX05591.1 nucleotidyltransferase [Sedimentibacter sp. zth1]